MEKIANLNQILGNKDYAALSSKEQKEYDAAFAAFKAEHTAKFPNGQKVSLAVSNVSLLPDNTGNYRIELKESANRYTPVLKKKLATIQIMFQNATGMPFGVVAANIAKCLNKGHIEMTVRIVDETDFYKTKDGQENYTSKGVARADGTEEAYVPSNEVRTALSASYDRLAEMSLQNMVSGMTSASTPAAAAATVPAAAEEDDEI